ncbi:MAG: amidohydrolase family protein [Clostridiales bacterium]
MKKLNLSKKIIIISVLVIFSLVFLACFKNNYADTIYINGNIYTVNSKYPKATTLAIKGQTLQYVGNKRGIKKYIGRKTKIINLDGKTVIPGIVESHMHFPMLGENLLKLDLYWKSLPDIIASVENQVKNSSQGEWIQGFGWNNEIWEDKNYPTKEMLDPISPDNPVVLERTDAHMVWANSKALEVAGITAETEDPQGGEIIKDKDGNPTGCLKDNAMNLITLPPYSKERKKEALLKAQDELLSLGITSCGNAGSPMNDIANMKELYQSDKLKIRIYCMVGGLWGEDPLENAQEYYKTGPEIGLYDNRFTVNTVKVFADGSLGSRSAALLEDYSDQPGNKGLLMYSDEELYNIIKDIRKNGFQASVHAIGDASIHQVLDVYERVLKEAPLKDHRYRSEHFQVSTLDDINRLAKLKVIPAMQPTHATSDKNMAEDRIGSERMNGAYAWRKILSTGSIIAGGSDAPVELANPYHGLYAAVTRMDREGTPPGGWYPEECMTRTEALKSFTIWSAYAQFEDKIKGSLRKGKLADFVVLDRDYFKCPDSEIKDIKALMTILGGEKVYEMQ